MKTRIILVGGFLGAGKTTLLGNAARKLTKMEQRVALITNDQAADLVDTSFLEQNHDAVSEISGSCFCCNFNGFSKAVEDARTNRQADIIIAEPVGSCTDLSATILQPLKEKFGTDFVVAPLSVLVDPDKLLAILDNRTAGLHPSSAYILKKQLEEADIIVINKMDLLTPESIAIIRARTQTLFPQARIFVISAKNDEAIELWLAEVLNNNQSGKTLADIDYDTYAEGEAVLGWLNTSLTLTGNETDWNHFSETLLKSLSTRFDALNATVGHVKMILEADENFILGNLTGTKNTLSLSGKINPSPQTKLILNARVQLDPEQLKKIVLEEISGFENQSIEFDNLELRCLSPGRPNPTFRYDHIV
jgi:G3E family GTPase